MKALNSPAASARVGSDLGKFWGLGGGAEDQGGHGLQLILSYLHSMKLGNGSLLVELNGFMVLLGPVKYLTPSVWATTADAENGSEPPASTALPQSDELEMIQFPRNKNDS